jgi:hypothetical protein
MNTSPNYEDFMKRSIMVKQKIKINKRYKPKTIDTNHLRTIYKYEKALPNFDRNLTFKLYDII